MGELKDTLNVMSDQLSSFASEVSRLAREVGTEGTLGGQIKVRGASGAWEEMTDGLNIMSANLTAQLRSLNDSVRAAVEGDASRRVTVEAQGEMKELRDNLNLLIAQSSPTA